MLFLFACAPEPADTRPWRPEDHDNTKAARAVQTSGVTKEGEEETTLIDVTWRQNCASCHGPTGRGDGPQGRMVRAPDLTRPDWQDRVSDASMANVIRRGRNKMPAFDALPPKVINGLVKRIRSWKR